jgi:Secretion system C-terminal sorting domain
MRQKILLFTSFLFLTLISVAQKAKRTYAVTGKSNNKFVWADIKQIDIATGKVVNTLFESDKTTFKSRALDRSAEGSKDIKNPTGFGVAGCALDERNGRLYFAPMHFSEISFLDLNETEASFTTVKKHILPVSSVGAYVAEEDQLSRMVIAADGYGYALTNDANHLIRFSTGRKTTVEDLGALIDAESNTGISIHNKCTSWGGDMLADAFGKLVVISANHNVYTIDPGSKIATFAGTITGLSANYTTNGAVVDNDGSIVVSSANVFDGLYRVNFKDLKAVKIPSDEKGFNASDMANGNFLLQQEADAVTKFDFSNAVLPKLAQDATARVYPNPVAGNQFNVLFENQKAGRYTILLTDIAGKILQSKVVNIAKDGQVESIRFVNKIARGTYLVKVVSENKVSAFSEKVIVQ